MKLIRIAKEITGAIGIMSMLFGIMSIEGFLEMEKSIIPTLVLLVVGLAFVWFFIVIQSYEEWKIAEENRIRDCINRYGRTIHVPGSRKRG